MFVVLAGAHSILKNGAVSNRLYYPFFFAVIDTTVCIAYSGLLVEINTEVAKTCIVALLESI